VCGSLYYNLLWFSWKGCCLLGHLHACEAPVRSAVFTVIVEGHGLSAGWMIPEWWAALTPTCVLQTHIHTPTPLCTVWRQFQSLFISSPPLLYAHTLWCTFEKLPLCKGLIWFFVRRMSFIWATHGRVHKSSRNAIDTLFVLTPLCLSHTHYDGDFPSTVFHCYFYPPIRHFLSLTLKSNPHWNIYTFLYS